MSTTTIRLGEGETAVVGYGSLLSRASIARTLGRPYDNPLATCEVAGWRRSWDVTMPNRTYYYLDGGERFYPERILYLNVRPVAEVLLPCVLFVLGEEDLQVMNEREWIYHRPVVNGALRGVRVEGGDAILYVSKPEHVLRDVASPRVAAVRRSYLSILENGLAGLEPAFRAAYERTTDPVPAHLVVDDLIDRERGIPGGRV